MRVFAVALCVVFVAALCHADDPLETVVCICVFLCESLCFARVLCTPQLDLCFVFVFVFCFLFFVFCFLFCFSTFGLFCILLQSNMEKSMPSIPNDLVDGSMRFKEVPKTHQAQKTQHASQAASELNIASPPPMPKEFAADEATKARFRAVPDGAISNPPASMCLLLSVV